MPADGAAQIDEPMEDRVKARVAGQLGDVVPTRNVADTQNAVPGAAAEPGLDLVQGDPVRCVHLGVLEHHGDVIHIPLLIEPLNVGRMRLVDERVMPRRVTRRQHDTRPTVGADQLHTDIHPIPHQHLPPNDPVSPGRPPSPTMIQTVDDHVLMMMMVMR